MRGSFSAAGLVLFATLASADIPDDVLRSVPMRFEATGRSDYRFFARGAGYAVALGDKDTLLATSAGSVRLTFAGADPRAAFQALEKSRVATNYFRGSARRSAPAYARIKRPGVYPGIDVVYYGTGQNLEYDFELAPGADPAVIALRFSGADRVGLDSQGAVVLEIAESRITQKLPVAYQRTGPNEVIQVASSYRLDSDGAIRFHIGDYDRARPLVIDPSIVLTGYLPGTGAEGVVGVARDAQGFVYLAGYTFSTDFALVGDSYNVFLRNGLREGWVTKFDPHAPPADVIVYSTFFGSSATDDPKALAVDASGLVYLTGHTDSFDYPTTPNGYITSFQGGSRRIFVAVLDTTRGEEGLLYSTYFGGTGTDEPTGIAVAGGKVYITGYTNSDDFPIQGGMRETRAGSFDAFLSVFDPEQSGNESLAYSTYFGGSSLDVARTLAVTPSGEVYLAGGTNSGDFPATLDAHRTSYSGLGDGFLARLNLGTNTVTYSTYVGGSDLDQVRKIVLQPDGRVGLTGYTFSYDFRVTQNALQPVYSGNGDVFLLILDPAASSSSDPVVYGTYFGGTHGEVAYDLRRDASGKYYLGGYTLSRDFPIRNALYPQSALGGADGFVAVLDPAAPPSSALLFSSFLTSPGTQVVYGVEVDEEGIVMVTGVTTGVLFEPGLAAPEIPSNTNVFVLFFRP
jgi:hypothetical protein